MENPDKIFLWGMMGVGKSTIGRKMAKRLQWNFIDLDEEIERISEKSIASIFDTEGEKGFRIIELNVLQDLLQRSNVIISTGGGTPCFHENASKMLSTGICIWINASVNFLLSRLNNNISTRPLLAHLNREERVLKLNELFQNRKEFYELAQIEVSAINFDLEATVRSITPLFQDNPRFLI